MFMSTPEPEPENKGIANTLQTLRMMHPSLTRTVPLRKHTGVDLGSVC